MPGSASAVSSRSGSGNAGTSSPATVGMAPSSAQIRVRTAAACARYRLALMIDQAAASYGEWNRTGRSQSCSRWSAPSTGSRSPSATHGPLGWSRDKMRHAWRATASWSASELMTALMAPSARCTRCTVAWWRMSSVTNASRISPPAGVGRPVRGPNPNPAAAASEKGPSGTMV